MHSTRRCTITTLTAKLLGDYDSTGSTLGSTSTYTTQPIEKEKKGPHDDVAGFCLAAPRIDFVSVASWLASLRHRALVCVECLGLVSSETVGPTSAYVAATDWRIGASMRFKPWRVSAASVVSFM
jgi:hypothetical protein